jgi:MFS family permease
MSTSHRRYALVLLCVAAFMVILDSQIVILALPSIEHALSYSPGGVQWVMSAYLFTFGGLLPSASAIVVVTFPEGAERNRALGIWSAMGGVGGTAALLLGGPIVSALGWRWVFLVNVPVTIAVLILSPRLLTETRDRTRPPSPLRLLRNRNVLAGNGVVAVNGVAAFGISTITSLYAQQVLHYAPWLFGLCSIPLPAGAVFGSWLAQRLVTRYGIRAATVGGPVAMALGALWLTRLPADGSYLPDLFPSLLLFGVGLGAASLGGMVASVTGVEERLMGVANGLGNTSFQLGGAVGVALLTSTAVAAALPGDTAVALTTGYHASFAVAFGVLVLGTLAGLAVTKKSTVDEPEPVPVGR